jgi:Uma2 family endonuclease
MATVEAPHTAFTFEQYLSKNNDPNRYEVIQGEVFMSPPPTINHELAVSNIAQALRRHLGKGGLQQVWAGRFALSFPDEPGGWVEPDLMFIGAGQDLRNEEDTRFEGVPDLLVEVQSPSTAHYDEVEKLARYASAGVPEYWLVNPRQLAVTVLWEPQGTRYQKQRRYSAGEAIRSTVVEGFSLAVEEVFKAVRRDRIL